MNLWAIEDALQDAVVFVGLDGRLAHSDSYNTVVDYNALASWYADQTFGAEALSKASDSWKANSNVGPCLKQVAYYIDRRLETDAEHTAAETGADSGEAG